MLIYLMIKRKKKSKNDFNKDQKYFLNIMN